VTAETRSCEKQISDAAAAVAATAAIKEVIYALRIQGLASAAASDGSQKVGATVKRCAARGRLVAQWVGINQVAS